MDYYESAEGVRISYARAMKEIARHGLADDAQTLADFHAELGRSDDYDAQAVLAFLGY